MAVLSIGLVTESLKRGSRGGEAETVGKVREGKGKEGVARKIPTRAFKGIYIHSSSSQLLPTYHVSHIH